MAMHPSPAIVHTAQSHVSEMPSMRNPEQSNTRMKM
jgi:hypothetical protein